MNIPPVVAKRLTVAIPKFKKVLEQARERDINEYDTVAIVADILEQVFGFDRYSDITREYAIQGTFCDLAIQSESAIDYLIEVKAVGIELKENHLRQAVNYASRSKVKWVVLTNGLCWEVHRVTVDGAVGNELILKFNFMDLNPRKQDSQEKLFLLCKRGVQKDLIDDYYEYKQSVNHYTIGAIILTEPVISAIRKELKKLKPGIKVDAEEIKRLVEHGVIKRELLESDAGKEANKSVTKMTRQQQRAKAKPKQTQISDFETPPAETPPINIPND